jgi:hypothetical protein
MERLCTTCGTVGPVKRHMPGSLFVEFILWLLFIIPGLIYSLWRHAAVYYGCARCGARNVIPLKSPIAQKFLAETKPGASIDEYRTPPADYSKQLAGLLVACVGICILIAVGVLLSPKDLSKASLTPEDAAVAAEHTTNVNAALHDCKKWTETHSKPGMGDMVEQYEVAMNKKAMPKKEGEAKIDSAKVEIRYRARGSGLLMISTCEYASTGKARYLVSANSHPK